MTHWQANRAEKRSYWADQIRRWRESGLTQIAYCRLHEINHHRLIYWRKQLSKGAPSSALVEISLNHPHDENLQDTPTLRHQSANVSVNLIKITKETPSLIREMKPCVFAVFGNLQTGKILAILSRQKSHVSTRIQ